MDFASDNTSGVAPQVMAALNAANEGHVPSYGADALSEAVRTKMRDLFEAPEAAVYLVATGTAANALSCALLTRPAAPAIADIHDRMPVVLSPADHEEWLAAEQRPEVLGCLVTQAREDFRGYPVSTWVNDPRNDVPELLEDLS